jgi:hypothetical protein
VSDEHVQQALQVIRRHAAYEEIGEWVASLCPADRLKILSSITRTAPSSRLDLGGFVVALGEHRHNAVVLFDTGEPVGNFDSYRGYYEDVAISRSCRSGAKLCREVHALAIATVGTTFVGYKGGDFRMNESSRLWVSQWGDASGIGISHISYDHTRNIVTLHTANYECPTIREP